MAKFWERAAHSVYLMFSLYLPFVILVISHFGFECMSSWSLLAFPFPVLEQSGQCLKPLRHYNFKISIQMSI